MFKKIKVKKILVPVMIFMIGTIFVSKSSQAENVNNLKSATVPEKITPKDPPPAPFRPEPRIPNDLRKHSLGIGIGQTLLAGSFEKLGENKITWDLLYSYSASHSFDLLVDFHHGKYEFEKQSVQTSGLAIGIKGKIYQFDSFSPFALFGFGFYIPKVKRFINNVLVDSEPKTTFGWHTGAGADLRLNSRVSVGVLFQFHNPFDVKQEFAPEVTGSYAKMLITGMYTF